MRVLPGLFSTGISSSRKPALLVVTRAPMRKASALGRCSWPMSGSLENDFHGLGVFPHFEVELHAVVLDQPYIKLECAGNQNECQLVCPLRSGPP